MVCMPAQKTSTSPINGAAPWSSQPRPPSLRSRRGLSPKNNQGHSMTDNDIPVVMTFAGTDPTGGAGIQAGIEAISSMGCHAAAVVTAVTVQDTRNVMGFEPVSAALVIEQARAVLEDMPVHAIKIGMIGSV